MSALRPRLARLVVVRVGAATLLLGLALALRMAGSALWPFDRAVLAHRPGSTAWRCSTRSRCGSPIASSRPPTLHFALDTLLIVAFVVVTGGVGSVFTPLFALPVVAAAGVRYRCGSLRMAAFASACLVAIVVAQYSRRHRCRPTARLLPPADVARITVGRQRVRVLRRRVPGRASWPRTCAAPTSWSRRASEKIADLEAFNRDVIDHLASGLVTWTRRPGADLQPRRGGDHRLGPRGRRTAGARRRCSCRRSSPPIWPPTRRRPAPPRRLHLSSGPTAAASSSA